MSNSNTTSPQPWIPEPTPLPDDAYTQAQLLDLSLLTQSNPGVGSGGSQPSLHQPDEDGRFTFSHLQTLAGFVATIGLAIASFTPSAMAQACQSVVRHQGLSICLSVTAKGEPIASANGVQIVNLGRGTAVIVGDSVRVTVGNSAQTTRYGKAADVTVIAAKSPVTNKILSSEEVSRHLFGAR